MPSMPFMPGGPGGPGLPSMPGLPSLPGGPASFMTSVFIIGGCSILSRKQSRLTRGSRRARLALHAGLAVLSRVSCPYPIYRKFLSPFKLGWTSTHRGVREGQACLPCPEDLSHRIVVSISLSKRETLGGRAYPEVQEGRACHLCRGIRPFQEVQAGREGLKELEERASVHGFFNDEASVRVARRSPGFPQGPGGPICSPSSAHIFTLNRPEAGRKQTRRT